jgi:superfamily I DNA and/or RNA helicase
VKARGQGQSPVQHSRRLSAADIGIITPYKAMADELRKLREARGIEVNTVDAFQVS